MSYLLEPWNFVGPDSKQDYSIWGNENIVRFSSGLSMNVAHRIVACVNACAGIDNATLESEGSIAGIILDKREQIATLRAQVKQLREALKALEVIESTVCVNNNRHNDFAWSAIYNACQALKDTEEVC